MLDCNFIYAHTHALRQWIILYISQTLYNSIKKCTILPQFFGFVSVVLKYSLIHATLELLIYLYDICGGTPLYTAQFFTHKYVLLYFHCDNFCSVKCAVLTTLHVYYVAPQPRTSPAAELII